MEKVLEPVELNDADLDMVAGGLTINNQDSNQGVQVGVELNNQDSNQGIQVGAILVDVF